MSQVPNAGSQVSSGISQLEAALGCTGSGGSAANQVCPVFAQVEAGIGQIPTLGSTLDSVLSQIAAGLGCTSTASLAVNPAGGTVASYTAPVAQASPADAVTAAADFTG